MNFLTVIASGAFWLFMLLGVPTLGMYCVFNFNEHCQQRFGFKFFTMGAFITAGIAAPCLYFGWRLYYSWFNPENGIAMMVFGAAIAATLYWRNIKKTNLAYGIGATSIVLLVLGLLAFVSSILYILLVVAWGYWLFNAKPVWIINK